MSILDEKEPTVSLKLVVAFVSIATLAAFAGLWGFNATHSASTVTPASIPAADSQGLL